jgi:hypothetical protein
MTDVLSTPVALILYNRPELTARVFEAVRQVRPSRLFVIADGPHPDRPGDARRCAAARAVVERIDWPCEVARDYVDVNRGLKRRVESGLSWLFARVEESIVLEDDCLPHPTFFPFCRELLARYRYQDRVMAISGNNFLFGEHRPSASYTFIRYPLIWGWATWRRAWACYDPGMRRWPELRSSDWLAQRLGDPAAVRYWAYTFSRNHDALQTWDTAWTLACWLHDGLCICPAVNLVSNLGFGTAATHTTDASSPFAALPAEPLAPPFTHPEEQRADTRAEELTERNAFSGRHFLQPMFRAMRAHLRSLSEKRG